MIKLFNYQIEAQAWLMSKHKALLSLSMGLGKTCVTITALEKLDIKKDHLNIVSYEFALNNATKLPKEFDAIVCDESHYLKNPKSKRTQVILGSKGIVHRAKRIWLLTGTPAPNNAAELWPMLFTFGQTTFKYNEFVQTYCEFYENAWGAVIITRLKPQAHLAIRKMLEPIMYQRTKEDVALDLPPISYHKLILKQKKITLSQIEINKDLREMFLSDSTPEELFTKLKQEELEFQKMLDLPNEIDVMNALSTRSQGVSTIRRYLGIQKAIEILPLIVDELENNTYQKIVIFAVHTKIVEYMTKNLKEFKAKSLYGATSTADRDLAVKAFQESDCRVLVCGISAAGVGLNLTRGSEVLMLELAFTPAYNSQAVMRCHRIGQKNNVRVRFVEMKDSLDSRITEILSRKSLENELIFN